jgi:hypothetical protein
MEYFLMKFLLISGISISVDSKMKNYFLDVNDILNDKFMPMSLMLLEGKMVENDLKNVTEDGFECATKDLAKDGTINTAFSTMGFHRKMINEFLCSKFVAGKILEEIQPQQIEKRLGVPKNDPDLSNEDQAGNRQVDMDIKVPSKGSMLFDDGSNEYKNWLSK